MTNENDEDLFFFIINLMYNTKVACSSLLKTAETIKVCSFIWAKLILKQKKTI